MFETVASYNLFIRVTYSLPLIISIILCITLFIRYSSALKPNNYINFMLPIFLLVVIFHSFMPILRILISDVETPIRMHMPLSIIDNVLPSALYGIFLLLFFYSFIYSLHYASKQKISVPSFVQKEIDPYSIKIIFVFLITFFCILIMILNTSFPLIEIINDPREFYRSTRSGYGHIYFTFGLLIKLLFLISLYLFKSKFIRIFVFIVLCFLVSLMGSKSQILNMFLIYVLYLYFIDKKSYNLISSLSIIVVLGIFLLILYLYLQDSNYPPIIKFLNIFDYFENFLLLYHNLDKFYLGILTIETNLYSIIPRIIYPEKPIYFGTFILGQEILPHQTYLNQGAPSFSFFGRAYADFGILASVNFIISGCISGYVIGALSKHRTIYSFIIILGFAYNPIFTFGTDGFVVEIFNIVLAFMLYVAASIIQLLFSRESPNPSRLY